MRKRRAFLASLALAASSRVARAQNDAVREGDQGTAPRRPPDAASAFLVRQLDIRGGFGAAAALPGLPVPAAPGTFVALQMPVAAAARGFDVFVADAGLGRVLRVDATRQTLQALPGLGARPGMRLAIGGDAGLLVLDTAARALFRLNRDGALVARIEGEAAGAADLAVDDATGMLWLADPVSARLTVVRGGGATVLGLPAPVAADARPLRPVALAFGRGRLVVLDAAGPQVLEVDATGRVTGDYGRDVLRQPRGIAADRHGRVYVVDAADHAIHVFHEGVPMARLDAAALGVLEPGDLRIQDDQAVLIDARSRRVVLYRVRAPSRGTP